MNIPEFLSLDYDANIGGCTLAFSEKWMGKVYSMTWFLVFGVLPIPLMVALYSTVVYKLWFKRQEEGETSHQQKVIVNLCQKVFKVEYLSFALSPCYKVLSIFLFLHSMQQGCHIST